VQPVVPQVDSAQSLQTLLNQLAISSQLNTQQPAEGPIRRPERRGSEWEPIKIFLKELSLCPNRNSKSHTPTPITKTT
jgi:hypothetical protein